MGEWLESLVPWGTEFIVWVQSFSGGWLRSVFRFFTLLGNEEFYLLLLPIVYWGIHKRLGITLGYLVMLSVWLNDVFKHLFGIPRPADARIQAPWPETSPSFPSGHSQNAVAGWGYLALRFRVPAGTVVAILLILGIGLSRIALGVHFPQDVLGGWAIGLVLLFVYARAEGRVVPWLGRQRLAARAALAVVVPLLLILIHPADVNGLYPAEGAITPGSVMVGLGIGFLMEHAWVRFRVHGPLWQRALRLAVGLVLIGILWSVPRSMVPEGLPYAAEAVIRFLRYSVLGWACAFFCPWLFVKLRLASQEGELIEPSSDVSGRLSAA
ncbi:MAG TPA: phosphatase PAP2 family protein [Anaerolineae bacterium]|nr:phosphatase PAP2 family protein [Anaerolineae bacterium]